MANPEIVQVVRQRFEEKLDDADTCMYSGILDPTH